MYLFNGSASGERESKSILKDVFADVGWETPRILATMAKVSGVCFDRVSQIRMDRWTKGRTALVGDAAACVCLVAGEGTGLAMAEAYVLAGELHRSGGDYMAAFARYQQCMMLFLKRKQSSAGKFASSFAPKSAFGIAFRNQGTWLLRIPFIADFFIGRTVRDDIELPGYGFHPTNPV